MITYMLVNAPSFILHFVQSWIQSILKPPQCTAKNQFRSQLLVKLFYSAILIEIHLLMRSAKMFSQMWIISDNIITFSTKDS